MNASQLVEKNLICKVMSGSHAYGMATESSDVDMRGIFCADPINLLTPFFPVKEIEDGNEEDTKYYELSHFMKLLIDQNPNIVELLWVREQDVLIDSAAYQYLRTNRKDFLSSKIAFTTSGYAFSQLSRMKGHYKWINNPQPINPPEECNYISLVQWYGSEKLFPSNFDINDYSIHSRLVPYGNNLYGLYQWDDFEMFRPDGSIKNNFDESRHALEVPLAIVKFNKEQYLKDRDLHKNYWSWKKNRNEVRAKLEEQHGYDAKHAAHLGRLLKMGHETLTTGEINVYRSDAQELLDIRNGSMTYDEIIKYAEKMDKEIKKAYNNTQLRKKVDLKTAANHLLDAQKLTWGENDAIR